jgi:hypothetical protein|tara:strand:+ start:110 stop:328 length:219 start_codon:yes stop_codon:yes gene_type:complete
VRKRGNMPKEEKALAEIRLWTTDYSTYEDEEILGLIEERAGFVLDSFDSETILKEIKLAKKDLFSYYFEDKH